jgi:hypothetical protein
VLGCFPLADTSLCINSSIVSNILQRHCYIHIIKKGKAWYIEDYHYINGPDHGGDGVEKDGNS